MLGKTCQVILSLTLTEILLIKHTLIPVHSNFNTQDHSSALLYLYFTFPTALTACAQMQGAQDVAIKRDARPMNYPENI